MDPLRKVKAGDGAGRLLDKDTFNILMDTAKFYRGRMSTKVGAGQVETDPLVPSCKVYIVNTTGSTLLPWSCVTPTGVAPIDPETLPVNANDQPVFEVQAPTATTDPVLITMEPIADGAIGEAAALGVCVAQVNVTSSAHRFAVPQVGSTASLASAASGPVRILAPWNTGNSTRLVMLCGQSPGGGGSVTVEEVDGSPSYSGITTLRVDSADGFSLSQPSAGVARLDFTASGTSITVQEVDLSPSLSASVVRFDQTDGFIVTQPGAGIARVDLASATTTQVGVIDTSAQSFAGDKTFTGSVIAGGDLSSFGDDKTITKITGGSIIHATIDATWPVGTCMIMYMKDTTHISTGSGLASITQRIINVPSAAHGLNAGVYLNLLGDNSRNTYVLAQGYAVVDASYGTFNSGVSGTFTAGVKTVTVSNGIITSIV